MEKTNYAEQDVPGDVMLLFILLLLPADILLFQPCINPAGQHIHLPPGDAAGMAFIPGYVNDY